MKTLFRGSAAIVALASMGGIAHAQTHQTTNQRHYSGNEFHAPATNPGPADTYAGQPLAEHLDQDITALQLGTRYTASTTAPDNTETATPTVSNSFTLTGTVTKDCSFYAGNNAAGRTIDFGVIGVKTGNNENVNAAFEMAGDLNATVNTLTAGCNFNNNVSISKGNEFGDGMNLVGNPGGFDSSQFQTNIPYNVTATWTGVALDYIGTGTPQSLTVANNAASGTKAQGAWRSAMNIAINAPAVTARGLVAGTYQDTLTVKLSAL